MLLRVLILLLFSITASNAQIVQFSGASVNATQYLEQQFPGTVVLLSTTLENSSYSGNCMEVRRTSDNTTANIGWVGKNCSTTAFDSHCNTTTCFLRTWYDQRNSSPNDCIQTTNSRQLQVLKTNSKLEIRNSTSAQGCEIADSATYKVTQPNIFVVLNGNAMPPGDGIAFVAGYTPTGDPVNNARWGLGWFVGNIGGGDGHQLAEPQATRNASPYVPSGVQGVLGGAGYTRSNSPEYVVWDFTPSTYEWRVGELGTVINSPVAGSNITYPTTQVLILGNGRTYANAFLGGLRMFVIYGSIQSSRNSISAFISSSNSQNLSAFPWTVTDADGFIFTIDYTPAFSQGIPDPNGIEWNDEFEAYNWAFGTASNVTNGKALVQYSVHDGDYDALANGSQRSERNSGTPVSLSKGTTQYWRSYQYKVSAGIAYTQGWCMTGQIHYDSGSSPDILFQSLLNDQIIFTTQRNGTDTDRNAGYSFTREVWRAVVEKIVWSVSGSADTLEIWEGVNGTTLTKRVNLTTPQAIFSTDTSGAYFKQGLYTGDRGQNAGGQITIQFANDEIATGVDALLARVTTQVALPTH